MLSLSLFFIFCLIDLVLLLYKKSGAVFNTCFSCYYDIIERTSLNKKKWIIIIDGLWRAACQLLGRVRDLRDSRLHHAPAEAAAAGNNSRFIDCVSTLGEERETTTTGDERTNGYRRECGWMKGRKGIHIIGAGREINRRSPLAHRFVPDLALFILLI